MSKLKPHFYVVDPFSIEISETVKKSPRKHEVFLRAPLLIEQFNLPLSPLFSCHGDFYILEMLNDPKVG